MTIDTMGCPDQGSQESIRFLWLEITGRCNLQCIHCYADSGPQGTHGAMRTDDWLRVIAAANSIGVQIVQFAKDLAGNISLRGEAFELALDDLDSIEEVRLQSNAVARLVDGPWDFPISLE